LAVYWWWHIVVLAGVKARCVHLCQVAGKNCVIPHGKCHSVAVRWNSINSYIPPLPWVDWKWRTGKRGPKKNKSRKILTEKCRTSNLWRSECGKWRTNLWWSQKVENGEPFVFVWVAVYKWTYQQREGRDETERHTATFSVNSRTQLAVW